MIDVIVLQKTPLRLRLSCLIVTFAGGREVSLSLMQFDLIPKLSSVLQEPLHVT